MRVNCAAVQAALMDLWYHERASLDPAQAHHFSDCADCQAFWRDLQALGRPASDAPGPASKALQAAGGATAAGDAGGAGTVTTSGDAGDAGGAGGAAKPAAEATASAFARLSPIEQAKILTIVDQAEQLRQRPAAWGRQVVNHGLFALLCAAVLGLYTLVWWRWGGPGLLAVQGILYFLMPWTLLIFSSGPSGDGGKAGNAGPARPTGSAGRR